MQPRIQSFLPSPQGPIYEEPLRGAGDALPGGAPYYGGGGQPLLPQNRPYQLYQDQPPPSQFYYSGDGRSAAMAGAPSSEVVDPWYSAGEQPTYGFGDVPYDSLVKLRSITQMWKKVSPSFQKMIAAAGELAQPGWRCRGHGRRWSSQVRSAQPACDGGELFRERFRLCRWRSQVAKSHVSGAAMVPGTGQLQKPVR